MKQKSNFERMIEMAENVFAVRSDPNQLNVDEEVIEKLKRLHPATVSEYDEGKGPIVWALLIPTTNELMNEFIHGQINEQQLLDLTPVGIQYNALYLCSAMTLPEYRNKGLTKEIILEAIHKIQASHPIQALFVWPFTLEGNSLARSIAKSVSLPLFRKEDGKSK